MEATQQGENKYNMATDHQAKQNKTKHHIHNAYMCVYGLYTLVKIKVCCASMFISLAIYLSSCLSVRVSVCLSVRVYVCLSVCLSVCQSVFLFVCQSVCLSICLSVCLYVIFASA